MWIRLKSRIRNLLSPQHIDTVFLRLPQHYISSFVVSQINSGLNYLFGIEQAPSTQVILIIVVSAMAATSVFFGLDKGIKRLSELNLVLALLLLIFVFVAGPSIYLLQTTIQNAGQ